MQQNQIAATIAPRPLGSRRLVTLCSRLCSPEPATLGCCISFGCCIGGVASPPWGVATSPWGIAKAECIALGFSRVLWSFSARVIILDVIMCNILDGITCRHDRRQIKEMTCRKIRQGCIISLVP